MKHTKRWLKDGQKLYVYRGGKNNSCLYELGVDRNLGYYLKYRTPSIQGTYYSRNLHKIIHWVDGMWIDKDEAYEIFSF